MLKYDKVTSRKIEKTQEREMYRFESNAKMALGI